MIGTLILVGAGILIGTILLVVNSTKPIPEKYKLKNDADLDHNNKDQVQQEDRKGDVTQRNIKGENASHDIKFPGDELSQEQRQQMYEKSKQRRDKIYNNLNSEERKLMEEYMDGVQKKMRSVSSLLVHYSKMVRLKCKSVSPIGKLTALFLNSFHE